MSAENYTGAMSTGTSHPPAQPPASHPTWRIALPVVLIGLVPVTVYSYLQSYGFPLLGASGVSMGLLAAMFAVHRILDRAMSAKNESATKREAAAGDSAS